MTLFWTWQYLELSHDYQLPRECSFNVRETSVKTSQLMFCFKGVLYLKEAEGLSAQQGSPLKDKSNFLFKSNQKVAWLLCLGAWFKKEKSLWLYVFFPHILPLQISTAGASGWARWWRILWVEFDWLHKNKCEWEKQSTAVNVMLSWSNAQMLHRLTVNVDVGWCFSRDIGHETCISSFLKSL